MFIVLIIIFLWVAGLLVCGMGFAEHNIPPTFFPMVCASLPIINLIVGIYLWIKALKNYDINFGKFKDFIDELKNL